MQVHPGMLMKTIEGDKKCRMSGVKGCVSSDAQDSRCMGLEMVILTSGSSLLDSQNAGASGDVDENNRRQ
jgi:hypothetical protein